MLANVVAHEVVDLPGAGPMLLLRPAGLRHRGPLPPQSQLPASAAAAPLCLGGRARPLAEDPRDDDAHAARDGGPRRGGGLRVVYRPRSGFSAEAVGSYDAIRTYLWLGMLEPDDPLRQPRGLGAPLLAPGEVPERIDVHSLRAKGAAPVGFAAALLPLARGTSDERRLDNRITAAARDGVFGDPPTYYDQNLVLFGRGFAEGRFHFERDGKLVPAWGAPCGR